MLRGQTDRSNRVLTFIFGFATLLFSPAADAAEPIDLEWHAPPSCSSEAQVLERLLAETPAFSTTTLRVRATIEVRDSEFVATLVLTNPDGESERIFTANDCGKLTAVIVLVVGLTVEEMALIHVNEPPEPEVEPEFEQPEPVPKPEPEPVPEPVEIVESPPEPTPPRPRPRVGLRAFGGGGYGPTTGGHGNVGGALALFGDRWRWELGGSWTTPRVVRADPDIRASFQGWLIGTRGCFVPIAAKVIELPLCAGIEAGEVRGRGLEPLPATRRASIPWVAPNLAQGLWWAPIERLAIGIEVELLVALTRGRFIVSDIEVERVAAIGLRALAGLEVRL